MNEEMLERRVRELEAELAAIRALEPVAWRRASGLITADKPEGWNEHDKKVAAMAVPLYELKQGVQK